MERLRCHAIPRLIFLIVFQKTEESVAKPLLSGKRSIHILETRTQKARKRRRERGMWWNASPFCGGRPSGASSGTVHRPAEIGPISGRRWRSQELRPNGRVHKKGIQRLLPTCDLPVWKRLFRAFHVPSAHSAFKRRKQPQFHQLGECRNFNNTMKPRKLQKIRNFNCFFFGLPPFFVRLVSRWKLLLLHSLISSSRRLTADTDNRPPRSAMPSSWSRTARRRPS